MWMWMFPTIPVYSTGFCTLRRAHNEMKDVPNTKVATVSAEHLLRMFILPLSQAGALVCVSISFIYEVIRIFAAYTLSRPSDELRVLKIQKVLRRHWFIELSVSRDLFFFKLIFIIVLCRITNQVETALEVASIKSVNLEFVRHSLLTRKAIKIEKRIETIQFEHAPKAIKIKNFFRICRVCQKYTNYCFLPASRTVNDRLSSYTIALINIPRLFSFTEQNLVSNRVLCLTEYLIRSSFMSPVAFTFQDHQYWCWILRYQLIWCSQ